MGVFDMINNNTELKNKVYELESQIIDLNAKIYYLTHKDGMDNPVWKMYLEKDYCMSALKLCLEQEKPQMYLLQMFQGMDVAYRLNIAKNIKLFEAKSNE